MNHPPSLTLRELALHASIMLLVIGALVWPALYNGQPFFHTDTSAYLRGADAGIQKFTHHSTPWTLSITETAGDRVAPAVMASVSSVKDKTILAGRSPFYGLLLYLGEITGGFWLSVIFQACVLVAAIALTARAVAVPVWPFVPVSAALLAVVSGAPFYASFLMPDLFAAMLILGASVLLSARRALQRRDYVGWFLLIAAASVFHDSHMLIALGMLCLGVVWNLKQGWGNWRGVAVLAAAVVTAASAQLALNAAINRLVGAPPLHAPFLTARLIDDGPGYRYMKATCPDNGFAVCAFIGRLPMEANEFLWSPQGVFSASYPELRRRLAEEQTGFSWSVFKYDPVGVILGAVRNTARQIVLAGLENFQYENTGKVIYENKLPAEHLPTLHRSAAYRGVMPIATFTVINAAVLLLAAAFLAWRTVKAAVTPGSTPITIRIVVWIAIGIVMDAFICGALSGPHIRYSERVQWLIPLGAMLMMAEKLERRSGTRP